MCPAPLELDATQRELFTRASEATLSNPFSDRRQTLDATIAGADRDAPRAEVASALLERLQRGFASLGEKPRFTDYVGEDREHVMHAMLFDTFVRYSPGYDALIRAQIEAGDDPVAVGFAPEAIGRLRAWGFSEEHSCRYFAILYQLRRAYFFINRDLPGLSESMRALRERLWRNVFTEDLRLYERHLWSRMEDFSTFLLGETGTGKGTAAGALGRSGWIPFDEKRGRFADSFTTLFVPINLSQFTESLIESELFGHRKGSFTGAIKHHEGIFGTCPRYGTIFLDEIGEVKIPIQIKLLNVLQDREYAPVGSHKPQRFEGRVIAATNSPIDAQRAEGTFRDDFFYRLCSDIIVMPTLRQRIREDDRELDELICYIVVRLIGERDEALIGRVREVIDTRLGSEYGWAGNVRELEQCVRRVILTGDYQPRIVHAPRAAHIKLASDLQEGELTVAELTARYCSLLYDRLGTYEAVAEHAGVDRRTVKKYIQLAQQGTADSPTQRRLTTIRYKKGGRALRRALPLFIHT